MKNILAILFFLVFYNIGLYGIVTNQAYDQNKGFITDNIKNIFPVSVILFTEDGYRNIFSKYNLRVDYKISTGSRGFGLASKIVGIDFNKAIPQFEKNNINWNNYSLLGDYLDYKDRILDINLYTKRDNVHKKTLSIMKYDADSVDIIYDMIKAKNIYIVIKDSSFANSATLFINRNNNMESEFKVFPSQDKLKKYILSIWSSLSATAHNNWSKILGLRQPTSFSTSMHKQDIKIKPAQHKGNINKGKEKKSKSLIKLAKNLINIDRKYIEDAKKTADEIYMETMKQNKNNNVYSVKKTSVPVNTINKPNVTTKNTAIKNKNSDMLDKLKKQGNIKLNFDKLLNINNKSNIKIINSSAIKDRKKDSLPFNYNLLKRAQKELITAFTNKNNENIESNLNKILDLYVNLNNKLTKTVIFNERKLVVKRSIKSGITKCKNKIGIEETIIAVRDFINNREFIINLLKDCDEDIIVTQKVYIYLIRKNNNPYSNPMNISNIIKWDKKQKKIYKLSEMKF